MAAALFAWHPLRVESVAWISERKDVLSGLLFFLILLSYAGYTRSKAGAEAISGIRQPALRRYLLTLGLFALGLLCKPMLVTVPLVLLLLDVWPLKRAQSVRDARGLILEKAPFLLLSLGVGMITFLSQRSAGSVVSFGAEGGWSRAGVALAGYLSYLEKTFWLRELQVLYPRPPAMPASAVVTALVVLFVISALAIGNFRRRPFLLVGWVWFVGMLLPVSGLAQTGLQFIADRYTYLPGIGLSLMLVWGAGEVCRRLAGDAPQGSSGRSSLVRWMCGAVAGLVLLGCLCVTRHQLAYWRNTETLMRHLLQSDPDNSVAHRNLGRYYTRRGDLEQARFHHQRAQETEPEQRPEAVKPP